MLTVLERQGQQSLDRPLASLARAPDRAAVIDLIDDWAAERSQSESWSLTIFEHTLAPGMESPFVARQVGIIWSHCRQDGHQLLFRFADVGAGAEMLGALLPHAKAKA